MASDDLAQQLFGAPSPMETQATPEEQQNLNLQQEYNKLVKENTELKEKYEALKSEYDEMSYRLESLEK